MNFKWIGRVLLTCVCAIYVCYSSYTTRIEAEEGDTVTIICRANITNIQGISVTARFCGDTKTYMLIYKDNQHDNLTTHLKNAQKHYNVTNGIGIFTLTFMFYNNSTGQYICNDSNAYHTMLVVPRMIIRPISVGSDGKRLINCTLPGRYVYGQISINKGSDEVLSNDDPDFTKCSTDNSETYLFGEFNSGKVLSYFCTLTPSICPEYKIYSGNLTLRYQNITTRPSSVHLYGTVNLQCVARTECIAAVGWNIGEYVVMYSKPWCEKQYVFYNENVLPNFSTTSLGEIYKTTLTSTICINNTMQVYLNLTVNGDEAEDVRYDCVFSSGRNTYVQSITTQHATEYFDLQDYLTQKDEFEALMIKHRNGLWGLLPVFGLLVIIAWMYIKSKRENVPFVKVLRNLCLTCVWCSVNTCENIFFAVHRGSRLSYRGFSGIRVNR